MTSDFLEALGMMARHVVLVGAGVAILSAAMALQASWKRHK